MNRKILIVAVLMVGLVIASMILLGIEMLGAGAAPADIVDNGNLSAMRTLSVARNVSFC